MHDEGAAWVRTCDAKNASRAVDIVSQSSTSNASEGEASIGTASNPIGSVLNSRRVFEQEGFQFFKISDEKPHKGSNRANEIK